MILARSTLFPLVKTDSTLSGGLSDPKKRGEASRGLEMDRIWQSHVPAFGEEEEIVLNRRRVRVVGAVVSRPGGRDFGQTMVKTVCKSI